MTNIKSGIYKIVNIINNKIYIGSSSINIFYRWRRHRYYLNKKKHHSFALQNAWNKYGEKNFIFEPIEFISENITIEREQFWIDKLKPQYNISKKAGSTKGCTHTEETKRKLRELNLGEKNPNYGKRFSVINSNKSINKKNSENSKPIKSKTIKSKTIKNKSKLNRCKSIISIDSNGIKKQYKSITEAAKFLKLPGLSAIQHVLKGRRKSCKGYKWEYL